MNIYEVLNKITLYIDENLTEVIDYEVIAKMLTTNVYTMQRLFSLVVGIPIGEYIRKRKLSEAAYDLETENQKLIDVALKYGYESSTTFSRAFLAFHGISPKTAKKTHKFKHFPRIIFEEKEESPLDIEYEVISLKELKLYELFVNTNNQDIKRDAPKFFFECSQKYDEKIKYAMISYKDKERRFCNKYSILYESKYDNANPITIKRHRYLKYTIKSNEAKDIQEMSDNFYKKILPSLKYKLADAPELEYYNNGTTNFLVPLENDKID